ncbi:hypothetical protein NN561_010168 [Cricetulus griseus]
MQIPHFHSANLRPRALWVGTVSLRTSLSPHAHQRPVSLGGSTASTADSAQDCPWVTGRANSTPKAAHFPLEPLSPPLPPAPPFVSWPSSPSSGSRALSAVDTRGQGPGGHSLPRGRPHPPRDVLGMRAPLCPAARSPARQLGRPLGGRIVRRICPRSEGPPGARARLFPAGGAPRRPGSRAISMRKERRRRLSWHSPRALIV